MKNPTFRTPSYRLGEEEIIVIDRGVPRSITDFPDLTFAINTANISRETIQVFVPHDDWNDPSDPKEEERGKVESAISDTVLSSVSKR